MRNARLNGYLSGGEAACPGVCVCPGVGVCVEGDVHPQTKRQAPPSDPEADTPPALWT